MERSVAHCGPRFSMMGMTSWKASAMLTCCRLSRMTMGVKDLGDEYELGMRQPMRGRDKNEKQVKGHVDVWIFPHRPVLCKSELRLVLVNLS